MKILITQKSPVLEIYTNKGLKVMSLKKIVYIKSLKKGSIIYSKSSKTAETGYILKAYSTILPIPYFFRCHNSFIVNCQYVDSFCNSHVNLFNNIKIPLARRRRSGFEKNLIEFEQNL